MENLEKILQTGYRDSILHKYFPENSLSYREWKELFSFVLEIFEGNEKDVEIMMKLYPYKDTQDPMKDILEYIINTFVSYKKVGPLWENIVMIKKDLETTPYTTYIKYTIRVIPKEQRLMTLSPKWVWENHEEVNNFMSSDNEFYKIIQKLDGKYTNL